MANGLSEEAKISGKKCQKCRIFFGRALPSHLNHEGISRVISTLSLNLSRIVQLSISQRKQITRDIDTDEQVQSRKIAASDFGAKTRERLTYGYRAYNVTRNM